ncbi:RNA-directed DNA polymerase, eukaryota [Tanacetum coccineum]
MLLENVIEVPIDVPTENLVKDTLLTCVEIDDDGNVRRRYDCEGIRCENGWPQLFDFIDRCVSGHNDLLQETAMVILAILLEQTKVKLMATKKNFDQLVTMVLDLFQDHHPRVRLAAINATGQLSTKLDPHLQLQYDWRVLQALPTAIYGCNYQQVQECARSAMVNIGNKYTPDILTPYLRETLSTRLQNDLASDQTRFPTINLVKQLRRTLPAATWGDDLCLAFALGVGTPWGHRSLIPGIAMLHPILVKKAFKDHYEARFNKPTKARLKLSFSFPNRLSTDQVVDLERHVSHDEIKLAVWDCGVNKSPGPDGFTFEFFRKFWKVIGPDFCEAWENGFGICILVRGGKWVLLDVGLDEDDEFCRSEEAVQLLAFSPAIWAGDGGASGENATHGVVLAPWDGIFVHGLSHGSPYLVLLCSKTA